MAITVRLIDQVNGQFYDPITGVNLRGTSLLGNGSVTSGDLTGLDCRNIIKGIDDYFIEITAGYLGPVSLSGSVAPNILYDMLASANRRIVDLSVICDGPGDIGLKFDPPSDSVVVTNGEVFSYELDIPVESLSVLLNAGASAAYRIVVK